MNKNNYPKTQSNLSQFGFGTYRLTNSSEHKTILKKAIQAGINLIDTATNYHHGENDLDHNTTVWRQFNKTKRRVTITEWKEV